MMDRLSNLRAMAVAALLVLVLLGPVGGAVAGAADEGRKFFFDVCSKCHGVIAEQRIGQRYQNLLVPVVMPPIGPNLTGVFGRPAGIYGNYRYSNAFRAAAKDIVWGAETLGRWLTGTQKMIRGSYMILKVEQPNRGNVIAYLETYSRYQK